MNRIWELLRKTGYWLRHTFAFRAPPAFESLKLRKESVAAANETD